MIVLLNVMGPIFALIGIGYLFARRRWVSDEGLKALSGFAFGLGIPALLFNNATTPHPSGGPIAPAFFAGCLTIYFLAVVLSCWLLKARLAESGVFALNATFGNIGMIGVPLITAAYGSAGLSQLLSIMALHSLILLPLTMLLSELSMGSRRNLLPLMKNMVVALVCNPIVMAVFAGAIVYYVGLPVPTMVRRLLDMLGHAGPPVALFCLGGTLLGFDARREWPGALLCAALKLALMPALIWALCAWVGLPPLALAVAVMTAALPTGANAFFLARRYSAGTERAGATILLSTIIAMGSLAALLVVFPPVE
ncbi:AEC family transporter [Acetobacteraceae bacterium H6797]|nr:AEC family transporter [Acetobacteraceae bacterium H6797]